VLWLGWNGFNGGDPYFAGADASTAVLNTNLATATALLTWLLADMLFSSQRRPTFLGCINGMITGLVAITPAAGFVNGFGALLIGLIASAVVWLSWNKLARTRLLRRVDDTLGVVHTHGVAGLTGGLLVGLLADPHIVEYLNPEGTAAVNATGLLYGNPKQLAVQAGAAATVIVWDALITFLILKFLGLFMNLRMPEEMLEVGDVAAHEEEAYPDEALVRAGHRSTPTQPPIPSTPAEVGAAQANPAEVSPAEVGVAETGADIEPEE
jgi:Amt family ammonium transporter